MRDPGADERDSLLGLVINQLQHPGAPFLFLFGFGSGPMDMRTMQSLFAHPTEVQIQGGSCDIVPEEMDGRELRRSSTGPDRSQK